MTGPLLFKVPVWKPHATTVAHEYSPVERLIARKPSNSMVKVCFLNEWSFAW